MTTFPVNLKNLPRNFADLSRKDGYFNEALKAYEVLIDNKEYERYQRNAVYGYALTLEEQLKTNDNVSKEQANNIIKRYKDLINLNSNSSEAVDAMFRIAMIKKKWLNNYHQTVFKNLIKYMNKIEASELKKACSAI